VEGDAAGLERRPRRRDVLHLKGQVAAVGLERADPHARGIHDLSVTVPVSNSAKLPSGRYMERRRPSVVP
jgi:hypothetical protein